MTKISVDEASAGPAMDAAIARISDRPSWPYSIDLVLAWILLDGLEATIHKEANGHGSCIIEPEYGFCMELLSSKAQGTGKTVPLAICRAFLKSHGVIEIEVT